ncbi:Gfo/Idh/MocA family protein [Paenibacillus radicis (ex Xue et al. 2023)]|uniref:Gfo/Idh/MocA family oxidoreductase n=1 Tax=Paenibacillus radicis (ex Xue et al. 2023) TaxID=2972489 RepID=A0ABT1YI11_9BACL|nr:Gfo/Idh/MocA family oxidoreductase [Paenibacillus radicis (ex Xue et al. 2023)]MCR8632812.1 Gfo/Idh/MocA family oxidoreductase [Paenibacillus radicis (ex Xue et al. 2023)]
MGSADKLKLGVIGAGNIGNVHIKEFLKLPDDCVITTITDAYMPLAEVRALEYGISHIAKSPDELIHSSEVDAVIIAVPNQFHAPLAIQALEAGKHVLLEKPMGLNADSSRQILEVSNKSDKVLMVAHQRRWQYVPMQIKEQQARGELGRIYAAKAGWLRRKGIPGWGTWFTSMDQSGGGPLIDIGVHMLDMALYLMGNPKPVSVYGSTYAKFGPYKKGIGTWGKPNWDGIFDVEDLATAMIKMEDGSTLSLDVSWAAHMETDSKPYIHLLGTEGGASYRETHGKFFTEKFNRPMETDFHVPDNDEGDRLRMCRHFIECIREGYDPICSALTGFTNNLILDAIYESSRTGNEVKLNWDI